MNKIMIPYERKCEEFRQWLDAVGGRSYEIEEGAFRQSGTGIKTMAVVIKNA